MITMGIEQDTRLSRRLELRTTLTTAEIELVTHHLRGR